MDQGEEEIEPDNEFLKGEKRRDPMEFAREYMRELKELMKGGGPTLGPAALSAPPRATEIHLAITQIQNGWLVAVQSPHNYSPLGGAQYVQRQADVPKVVLKLVEAALGPDPGVSDFRTPPPEGLYPAGNPPAATDSGPLRPGGPYSPAETPPE